MIRYAICLLKRQQTNTQQEAHEPLVEEYMVLINAEKSGEAQSDTCYKSYTMRDGITITIKVSQVYNLGMAPILVVFLQYYSWVDDVGCLLFVMRVYHTEFW